MSDKTPLDALQAAIDAAPGNEAPRRAFWERLATSELFLLLASEPSGETFDPMVLETGDARIVLAFDREDRLAEFIQKPTPYLAVAGRALVATLGGRGFALGLNLEVSDHPALLPPEALDWAAGELGETPQDVLAEAAHIGPPEIGEALLDALAARLSAAPYGIGDAWLAAVTYRDGSQAMALALTGVEEAAQAPLAAALSEAHRLIGRDRFDIVFLDEKKDILAAFRRRGIGISPVQPDVPRAVARADRPPRLR